MGTLSPRKQGHTFMMTETNMREEKKTCQDTFYCQKNLNNFI